MLKIFIGVVLGYLLFTSPQARRITGQLLRTAAEVISPETKPALNESVTKDGQQTTRN
jgi:hypothetical protein